MRSGVPALTGAGKSQLRGFTMIELLVVLVILGMLAGLVGPRLFGKLDSSKAGAVQTQVKMLKGALQTYRLDVGNYPSTQDGLDVLVRQPSSGRAAQRWKGPYLDDEVPLDPWENPFVYVRKPSGLQEFSLYSLGADGEPGGDGLDADIGYTPDA